MPIQDFDIAIIGGGPAGLTAALYAGRNRERAVLLEGKAPGGQLLNTELIEDYPGFLSILGVDLATVMEEQAAHFGTALVRTEVRAIKLQPDGIKLIETYDGDYRAPAVIITAGGNPRKLDVPGEEEFAGRGVSYCAVCDGAFFKDVHLAVVGGGDAAVEEALFLTRYASRVTIIHRRRDFRAQPILLHEARAHPKIDFLARHRHREHRRRREGAPPLASQPRFRAPFRARGGRRVHLCRFHPQHRPRRRTYRS